MNTRVLVADDDPVSRELYCCWLESWGYEPVAAASGTEALTILLGTNPPRLALLDWVMPGCSGVDVCARLRQQGGPLIYCLLLTARTEKTDLTHALDQGAHNFLPKPVDPDILHISLKVGKRLVDTDDTLLRLERVAAVGTLAAGAAHQYNNLNAGLVGYLDVLLGDPCLSATQRGLLEKMDKICRRMKEMTGMLLGFADTEEREWVPVSLPDLADKAIEIEREKLAAANAKLCTSLLRVPLLRLDKNNILQAVLHLFDNACHAVRGCQAPRIGVAAGVREGQAFLRIEDNGCGIPADRLREIFTPFFTLKGEHADPESPQSAVKGYGLGLCVADSIVRRHGGRIAVESEAGKGSRFTIYLPMSLECREG